MALQTRPPVVTILGHVDHGKTTLLDFIRKSKVAASEHGGITQAIGAYQVSFKESLITFIDTPGHAAFEKMRARGAALADIAVLVVAVDDGVMPQTLEAIRHIQEASVAMVVAVNKIDLPGVKSEVMMEKIKKQLSDQGVLVEEYGGDVPIVQVSAKTGQGVDNLLETIQVVAEVSQLQADPDGPTKMVVIEARLDKYRGPLATVLVRDGTLKKGDPLGQNGKAKGMFSFSGQVIDQASPSTPVEVLGFETVPSVGIVVGSSEVKLPSSTPMRSLIDKLKQSQTNVLNVIIKTDKQGSLEAIETALEKFNEASPHLRILSSGTGEINDSDVDQAASAKAIILGFNTLVRSTAQRLAQTQHVLIRNYQVIYELIEEMEEVVEGMLKPQELEEVFGRSQIVAEFPYGKNERIAGCKVVEGVISKGPKIRIVRDDAVVGEGKLKSIKRNKEETSKVETGQECGFIFDPKIDFQIGDVVESYRTL